MRCGPRWRWQSILGATCVVACIASVGPAQPSTPVPPAEVLAADLVTSNTWTGVRARLELLPSRLRVESKQPGREEELHDILESTESDLAEFDRLADAMAPELATDLRSLTARIRRVLDFLAIDYANGDNRRLADSLRRVEDDLERVEQFAQLSDEEMQRRRRRDYLGVPPGWGGVANPSGEAAAEALLLNAGEISREIAERRETMRRLPPSAWRSEAEAPAREVGEFARALLRRQGEVPELSRRGFRNAALRMEVISDNLVDFALVGNRPAFHRQIAALGEALNDVDGYLRVREAIQQAK